MKFPVLVLCMLISVYGFGQTVKITARHHDSAEPIAGATVSLRATGQPDRTGLTDSTGVVRFSGLSAAVYKIEITHVGFEAFHGSVRPQADREVEIETEMEESHGEEEEVLIQSTRSTRSISDIPTRVEFIAGEELDEKSNMKPGDIRMVLNESTGIQTQQTSATSANSSIRIQGLDGRYTQILKDGFPVYAGMSSGLGLLQTPPLDLQQIEVIKGSASTLYGGGAIAGLVNLISKKPGEDRDLKFHIDLTSAGGINSSGFYAQKFRKMGITLFGARNSNAPYDPADIGLTAIPKFERYTLAPRLFFYLTPRTELTVGASLVTENRIGGDIAFIRNEKPSGYFERNNSERIQTQLKFEHLFGDHSHLVFKSSYSFFDRRLSEPGYAFGGKQHSTFSELSYASHGDRMEWIAGLNLMTDDFRETAAAPITRDDDQLSAGAFVQNNWRPGGIFILESGIRGEYVDDYGFILLPRLSALFKLSPKLSSRIGGGLGYRTPTMFTEESERLQYRNILPVDPEVNKLERSYGLNADLNFRTRLGGFEFSINQLFFYTRIEDPLVLMREGLNYRFVNEDGHFDSRGLETNIKLGYHDFKLFLGYTFTDAYLHTAQEEKQNYLTPRHRLNSVLLYELHGKWKVGLEGYYFGEQLLSDGGRGRSYWVTGFMAEKFWEKFSLYINFENFLDARQTRWGSIYNGTISQPVFRDIYAPLDGFVVNGGLKLRL